MARAKTTPVDVTDEAEVEASITNEAEAAADPDNATVDFDGTPEEAEEVLDFTPIDAALDAAIEGKDETTGEVSVALLSDVTAGYRALQPKSKISVRSQAKENIKAFMTAVPFTPSNVATARAWLDIQNALKAGKEKAASTPKAPKAPKAPANPTENYVSSVVAARLAYSVLVDTLKPEGLDADFDEQIETVLSALSAEMVEAVTAPVDGKVYAPEILKAAKFAKVKTARTKSAGGSVNSGPNRDLGKHILEALSSTPGVWMSVASIQNFASEEYDGATPSGGAISNRLFPPTGKPCTLDGVVPSVEANKKGATLVVAPVLAEAV